MEKTTQKQALQYVVDNFGKQLPEDIAEIIKAMANKKTKAASKKDTEEAQVVLDAILLSMADNASYLVGDLIREVDELNDFSTSKATAYMKWLLEDGKVTKKIEKGRSYYSKVLAE